MSGNLRESGACDGFEIVVACPMPPVRRADGRGVATQFRCAENDRGSHVDRGMQHEIGCRRQFDIAEGLADTLGKRIAAMNENGNVGAKS